MVDFDDRPPTADHVDDPRLDSDEADEQIATGVKAQRDRRRELDVTDRVAGSIVGRVRIAPGE